MCLNGGKEILEQCWNTEVCGVKWGRGESGYRLRVLKMSSFNGSDIEKRHSGVFFVNFEHIPLIFLVFILQTLRR